MKKRIVSLLLTLVMVLSLVPMSVFAADNHDGQVHVIVENTTYPEAEGAPWEGTLVEEWIDLNEDSTMMGCVVEALEKNGYEQTGAENNYISSIEGLGEFDGGSMSGWMGTLNDWFTNYGFGAFTVAAGTLGSGDEIRIMYTRNGYGADLGGSWDNHIKTVKALTFSANVLAQLPQVTLKLSGYAADAVEKLIDAIGTVTLNSEEAIKAARDAYDALTEEQKAQVGNYQTLLDAEAKLADLQAADAVEKLIDAIGTVTLDSEEAIKAARGAYDALTEEQKAQVGNYQTLLDAEAKLAQLKKDAEKPSQPEQPAKPSEDANKPATGDAGVALWLTVMCMTSLLGAALVGKKRKA